MTRGESEESSVVRMTWDFSILRMAVRKRPSFSIFDVVIVTDRRHLSIGSSFSSVILKYNIAAATTCPIVTIRIKSSAAFTFLLGFNGTFILLMRNFSCCNVPPSADDLLNSLFQITYKRVNIHAWTSIAANSNFKCLINTISLHACVTYTYN